MTVTAWQHECCRVVGKSFSPVKFRGSGLVETSRASQKEKTNEKIMTAAGFGTGTGFHRHGWMAWASAFIYLIIWKESHARSSPLKQPSSILISLIYHPRCLLF